MRAAVLAVPVTPRAATALPVPALASVHISVSAREAAALDVGAAVAVPVLPGGGDAALPTWRGVTEVMAKHTGSAVIGDARKRQPPVSR